MFQNLQKDLSTNLTTNEARGGVEEAVALAGGGQELTCVSDILLLLFPYIYYIKL